MKNQKKSNDQYYHALTKKLIIRIIIGALTPMIIVSAIILEQFHTAYIEKVHAHLGELVLKHKQNIDSFLVEKLHDIQFLSKSFNFEQLSDESFLQERLTSLREEYNTVFVDLGVIDEDGLQVAYAGPFKLVKAVYSEAGWFQNAIKSRYFVSDVFLGLRGHPHFIIAVRQNWHGKYWILRATIDFMAFNSLVENLRVGKTGFAFILNKEGKFQTKPLRDVVPDSCLNYIKDKNNSKNGIYILDKKDQDGKKKIYVISFLKNGEWLMVFQQDMSDAFSELNRAQMIAFFVILFASICIITMAVFFSKKVVKRISRTDREKNMMNQQVIETGKLASIGELASGIAHEINNPVAIMVEEAGWIGDLLEEEEFHKSENLDEFERAIKQIQTQGKRCKSITHKLLSFARKTDSRMQDIQINDLITEMIVLSEQRAKYSNVTMETDFRKDLPSIMASESELQQVFLNLINNALDAMNKNGGTINVATKLENDSIVIDFADNGSGIPAPNLARIFDPFFTTKQVGKGTGLGLSICYGIINKLGGKIDVRSAIDIGTTFSIWIPISASSNNESKNNKEKN
ncbi:MAG: two-component sensor histidine kinase [Desulfosarcina sp.]|nr:two-component sensor histidine kinase [Desulfobacterales bacterium]